jgi:hypothetical protein
MIDHQQPTPAAFFKIDPSTLGEPAKATSDRAVLHLINRLEDLYRRRKRISWATLVELWACVGHAAVAAEKLAEAGRRGYSGDQLARHRRN